MTWKQTEQKWNDGHGMRNNECGTRNVQHGMWDTRGQNIAGQRSNSSQKQCNNNNNNNNNNHKAHRRSHRRRRGRRRRCRSGATAAAHDPRRRHGRGRPRRRRRVPAHAAGQRDACTEAKPRNGTRRDTGCGMRDAGWGRANGTTDMDRIVEKSGSKMHVNTGTTWELMPAQHGTPLRARRKG